MLREKPRIRAFCSPRTILAGAIRRRMTRTSAGGEQRVQIRNALFVSDRDFRTTLVTLIRTFWRRRLILVEQLLGGGSLATTFGAIKLLFEYSPVVASVQCGQQKAAKNKGVFGI